ncbi:MULTISPECIES: IctB family putative bicarbonate transporter [Moorena]|uniref:Putative bicarbonate transporter, IctB family n=1 Tax=Moorena producens 3L TaxID=489825 RepID=F4XQ73_9CYAN|nr:MULTISPECIES: IctB family putative bicarbonate transporter [Moorena]NES83374.1 putative bicarbonate transporter, IctB family [Moorena sp. SIO2B7]EGJ33302.1 putative bicarbonate transporter, IctB family [Moorena producens 3L]NEP31834.1 putative bicarbonate transporter, IctB family [Moorena sp. SIO3B2]NEP70138.1 putative bicarbonate transporter, IctB family [Moorena sp. SIO3A5]NEQ06302.1 putative bicarbonate transporter, IctB family [Moorena sp. SIO4E2]
MNSAWAKFTLSNLQLYRWRGTSYLYRLVGLLDAWRQSSLLLQWSDPIGAMIVALVLSLAPFVSNALVGILLIASAGLWVLLTLSDDIGKPKVSPIHLLVFLYWSVATIATALSPVKGAASSGLVKLTLYLFFFALMARVLRSRPLRSWIITLFLHISLIVSIYGLRQWFFGAEALATWVDPTSAAAKLTRVYSYLGNPNLLAGYLIPAVALSLAAVFVWQGLLPKALALTMVVVNSICLVLTFSRGGWIGFVVCIFVFLILLVYWYSVQLPPKLRPWAMPALLSSCAGVMLLAVMFVPAIRDRIASIFVGREDSSNNFRMNVWSAVMDMIRDRPIIGIGPGNNAFNKIYPLFQRPKYTALSAYSIFLETAVEMGLIGMLCFLWLLIVTFNQGMQQLSRLRNLANRQGFWLMGAIATMSGMLAHGLVDTVWYRPQVQTLWWLVVAIIASFYVNPNSDPSKV